MRTSAGAAGCGGNEKRSAVLFVICVWSAAASTAGRGTDFVIKQSENNCYGDPSPCWFRGRTATAVLCQSICAADPACKSFTHVGATGDSFQHECRTRNDTAWILAADAKHTAGHKGPIPKPLPFFCRNATDCNNAGDCEVSSGSCSCDAAWKGQRCDTLNLLPAQSLPGNGLQAANITTGARLNTWGGSIVAARPPSPKGFHMFASLFLNGTLNDWEHKSVVVHATSAALEGPYELKKVVLAPRRDTVPLMWDSLDGHNPTVHYIDGEYVVFYIGVGVSRHTNSSQQYLQADSGADLPQSIGAAWAASPEGPWQRTAEPLLAPLSPPSWECGGTTSCGVSNPAIVLMGPGGGGSGGSGSQMLMFYRGNNDRGVGVATAKSWRGPWTRANNRQSIFPPGVVIGLEDLYVWRNPTQSSSDQRRPGCQMVLHQEEQGVENLGAHAFTTDSSCTTGWTLSYPRPSRAYGPEFAWTNGSTTTTTSRERPQVVLGDGSGAPVALSNGVITSDWAGASYTVVAPINNTDSSVMAPNNQPAANTTGFEFYPAAPASEQAYWNTSLNTWGGSVYAENATSFHMFMSAMAGQSTLSHWETASYVVRAVSQTPSGPFKVVQSVLPTFHHSKTRNSQCVDFISPCLSSRFFADS